MCDCASQSFNPTKQFTLLSNTITNATIILMMLAFTETEITLFNQIEQRGLEETNRLFLKVLFPLEYATDGKPEPKRLCEIVRLCLNLQSLRNSGALLRYRFFSNIIISTDHTCLLPPSLLSFRSSLFHSESWLFNTSII